MGIVVFVKKENYDHGTCVCHLFQGLSAPNKRRLLWDLCPNVACHLSFPFWSFTVGVYRRPFTTTTAALDVLR